MNYRLTSPHATSLVTWSSSSAAAGSGPLSASACVHLTQRLLRSRLPSKESDAFIKRAIDSLVRKLRDRRDEVDALYQTVQFRGSVTTKCITIARSLDGRLQVAGRKCFPHVVYARIWRWPDVHKNEMVHIPSVCQYGFTMKRELVCVNPYHYERVAAPHMSQEEDASSTGGDSKAVSVLSNPTTRIVEELRDLSIPSAAHRLAANLSVENDEHKSSSSSADNLAALHRQHARYSTPQGMAPSPTVLYSAILLPQNAQLISNLNAAGPSRTSQNCNSQALVSTSNLLQMARFAAQQHSQSAGGNSTEPRLRIAPPSIESTAQTPLHVDTTGSSPRKIRVSLPKIDDLQKSRRGDELWCIISYFEYATNVGEPYRVPNSSPQVVVDGFTDPKAQNRFCLGQLPNLDRTAPCEKVRMFIRHGICLSNGPLSTEQHVECGNSMSSKEGSNGRRTFGNGSVTSQSAVLDDVTVTEPPGGIWLQNRSDRAVFLRSHYLDVAYGYNDNNGNNNGNGGDNGDTSTSGGQCQGRVHKIYPRSSIQVYDLQWWREELLEWAARLEAGKAPPNCVDLLTAQCGIQCSFIKGWGIDYPRRYIQDTPCWIEVQFHDALILLDHMLLQVNLASSLDEGTTSAPLGQCPSSAASVSMNVTEMGCGGVPSLPEEPQLQHHQSKTSLVSTCTSGRNSVVSSSSSCFYQAINFVPFATQPRTATVSISTASSSQSPHTPQVISLHTVSPTSNYSRVLSHTTQQQQHQQPTVTLVRRGTTTTTTTPNLSQEVIASASESSTSSSPFTTSASVSPLKKRLLLSMSIPSLESSSTSLPPSSHSANQREEKNEAM